MTMITDPMTPSPEAVEAAACAIWAKRGGIPRLFDEPAQLGSNLAKQQFQCWEFARAALTAAAPLMVAGWQAIETAPKDGTEVLVWQREGTPRTARYMTSIEEGDGAWIIARSVGRAPTAFAYASPSHWMPLPAPPEAA